MRRLTPVDRLLSTQVNLYQYVTAFQRLKISLRLSELSSPFLIPVAFLVGGGLWVGAGALCGSAGAGTLRCCGHGRYGNAKTSGSSNNAILVYCPN